MLSRAKFYSLLVIVLATLALSACGFQPMYGKSGVTSAPSIREGLDQVAIGNIPDQEGQQLRNLLIDRFYSSGRPPIASYTLDVSPLRETRRDLDITKKSDATRGQLRIQTHMRLTDNKTGKLLIERELIAVTSYNVLESQFTTRVSETAARESALQDIARQIELHIALYLKRAGQ